MSSTVRSYGFVALLDNPLTDEEREELSEELYDNKSCLNINYEGTLVYIDFNQHLPYSVREDIYGLTLGNTTAEGEQKFLKALKDNGLVITAGTIQPFDEIYWNGGDSYIDLITAESYLKAIGFN